MQEQSIYALNYELVESVLEQVEERCSYCHGQDYNEISYDLAILNGPFMLK